MRHLGRAVYFVAGNGTDKTSPMVSTITQTGENLQYTYDNAGNILTEKRGSVTVSYVYDALGQLTRVNDPNDPAGGTSGTTWVYTYDQGGNILNKKRYAYTTGTLGSVQQTITYTYGDTNWRDKMTAYNGTSISYAANGNPTGDGTWTYTWEHGRQLKTMSKTGTSITYAYNADGLRVKKTVNGTTTNYYLHGKNIVRIGIGTTAWMHIYYDAQNRPSVVNYIGTLYRYIYNLQGDVLGLLDPNGTEVVKYVYDAWGRVLSTTGSLASTLGTHQPFRYRGYVYDVETGLYYLRSRYYNPVWERFINSDQLVSVNLFAYCKNNPIVCIDPFGTKESLITKINRWLVATFFPSYAEELSEYYIDEQTICYNYPISALIVDKTQKKAGEYTNMIFGDNATNMDGTIANAFKHAFWNALMVRDIGEKRAEQFATAHEAYTQTLGDKPYLGYTEKLHSDMDLYYNELGRANSKYITNDYCSISDEELATIIFKAVMLDQSHVLIKGFDIRQSLLWFSANGGV